MTKTVREGDAVLLLGPEEARHLVRASAATQRVEGLGVVPLGQLLGKPWGSEIQLGPQRYALLRPLLTDHLRLLNRKAQIILAKDAARIVLETGIHAGSRLAEAGVGSGALTVVLAHAVAPTGRIFAYDLRKDHLDIGRGNVERAGLADVVDFQLGDVTKDLKERELDAFIVDIPDPAAAVDPAWDSLGPSGVFASYSPIVGQVESVVRALRTRGFLEVRSFETLERGWVVHERGSRPETNMLAHTGFLTFARHP